MMRMAIRVARGPFVAALLSTVVVSCGGAPAVLVKGSEAKNEPPKRVAAAEVATDTAAATEEDVALPAKIDSILQLVPANAVLVVSLPRPDKLLSAIDPATRDTMFSGLTSEIAGRSGLEAALVKSLAESFEEAVAFVGDAKPPKAYLGCLGARFRDAGPVEKLLATTVVRKKDARRFVVETDRRKEGAPGVWLPETRVLVVCTQQDALSASLGAANGKNPSFQASPLFVPERAKDVFVAIDLARFDRLIPAPSEPGSRLFASLASEPNGISLDVRFSGLGQAYPALGLVLDASVHGMMAKLPRGALGGIALSSKRSSGKTIADVFAVIDRAMDGKVLAQAEQAASAVGFDLADVEAALGGELAVGVYRDPKYKLSLDERKGDDPSDHLAGLVAIAVKDAAAQKKIFAAVVEAAKKQGKKFAVKPDSISRDLDEGNLFRLESRAGFVLVGLGDKKLALDLLGKFGKDKETLAANKAFADTRSREEPASHLLAFFDAGVAKSLIEAAPGSKLANASGLPSFLSLALGPSDRGLDITLTGHGAGELLGIGASLSILGVNRYIRKAKSAEARNYLGILARSVVAAYERERLDAKGTVHKLCKSATPVPAVVPAAKKYMPSDTPGEDFSRGDASTGWACLGFDSLGPVYYQYDYRAGGNYKGPKRGGPNPGKDGFEVSAEGDLDGDGTTSLFTRTGKIEKGTLTLDTQIFVSDELE
jgi:hypothetical protein